MQDDALHPATAAAALDLLWRDAGLPPQALARIELPGSDPVLPSSFRLAVAAQASIGASALAAAELRHLRGGTRQDVSVDATDAVLECTNHFTLNGVVPPLWDKLSGLYPCAEGTQWVRIHANFAHHRDGALRLLGLPEGPATERAAVQAALASWSAEDFEAAAADAGLVVAALRDFETWDLHAQARALSLQPLLKISRIGDATPLPWPALDEQAAPLQGLRVVEMTRILAGPVCGRTLAAHGADVMLINGPHLPNIEALADTSRGKLSAHLDLREASGREGLRELLRTSHVFVQGYRPGALAAQGFGAEAVAALRPGIVMVSLSAYGTQGPWAGRRGFDSLVQTACGINAAEAQAAGSSTPRALPCQMIDYASGYLMALGAQAALARQQAEGGSWHVEVTLARTAAWLRSLGRVQGGFAVPRPEVGDRLEITASGFGALGVLRHPARMSATPPGWVRPSVPPGTHPPVWP